MSNIRILIADDHELIRRGLVSALADRPDWSIVAEAADGRQACELAARLAPDIAVLDLTMPELNGLDATRQIRAATPKTRILIVTAHESEQLIRDVLDAGAMGYVLKSDAGRVLVQAIEALLDERPFFTSKVARVVLEGYLRSGEDSVTQAAVALSPRERQIVQLLAEGSNNKEVARALQLSVKTVETHRSNIMRKMEFGSLADLVRYAIRNKIVDA
ncbi:MAG TPA: response regulator transcription factor [Steroidobacteraceae bacterium]|jgi:DNA-binding NarL/FixJ family response regulator|nr:response regulator transcription factor [Steroidobacteraceae bacterium]